MCISDAFLYKLCLHVTYMHNNIILRMYMPHTYTTQRPLTTDPAIDEVVANRINGTPLGDDAVRR